MVVAAPAKGGLAPRVQSFRELEEADSAVPLPASAGPGAPDMSLLVEMLCPASQVAEPDTVWDHELLLNQIQHEIALDKEAMQEKEKEAAGPTAAAAPAATPARSLAAPTISI